MGDPDIESAKQAIRDSEAEHEKPAGAGVDKAASPGEGSVEAANAAGVNPEKS